MKFGLCLFFSIMAIRGSILTLPGQDYNNWAYENLKTQVMEMPSFSTVKQKTGTPKINTKSKKAKIYFDLPKNEKRTVGSSKTVTNTQSTHTKITRIIKSGDSTLSNPINVYPVPMTFSSSQSNVQKTPCSGNNQQFLRIKNVEESQELGQPVDVRISPESEDYERPTPQQFHELVNIYQGMLDETKKIPEEAGEVDEDDLLVSGKNGIKNLDIAEDEIDDILADDIAKKTNEKNFSEDKVKPTTLSIDRPVSLDNKNKGKEFLTLKQLFDLKEKPKITSVNEITSEIKGPPKIIEKAKNDRLNKPSSFNNGEIPDMDQLILSNEEIAAVNENDKKLFEDYTRKNAVKEITNPIKKVEEIKKVDFPERFRDFRTLKEKVQVKQDPQNIKLEKVLKTKHKFSYRKLHNLLGRKKKDSLADFKKEKQLSPEIIEKNLDDEKKNNEGGFLSSFQSFFGNLSGKFGQIVNIGNKMGVPWSGKMGFNHRGNYELRNWNDVQSQLDQIEQLVNEQKEEKEKEKREKVM